MEVQGPDKHQGLQAQEGIPLHRAIGDYLQPLGAHANFNEMQEAVP